MFLCVFFSKRCTFQDLSKILMVIIKLTITIIIPGAAVGYMMGHGGAGMLSGIDGGPRMAIGGNYVGL